MTHSPVTRRSGLTLVEILIAMVMTLIVLLAMMEAFKYASGEMQRSRATIELSNQLRAAQELLRSDLEHMTLDPRPWTQTALPKGYFEYVEGPRGDADGSVVNENLIPPKTIANREQYSYLGDVDDIISFTVNRPEQPFRGRWLDQNGNEQIVESPMAEIVWWTDWDDRNLNGLVDFDESVTVYRRVLLIRPDLAMLPLSNVKFNPSPSLWASSQLELAGDPDEDRKNVFRSYCDISCRYNGTNMVANSLEDLGHRGNRFCNITFDDPGAANGFPHVAYYSANEVADQKRRKTKRFNLTNSKMASNAERNGDDVVLTNVAGFDVRVYSPNAAVQEFNSASLLVEPSDVLITSGENYVQGAPNLGAFVDLNYGGAGWFGPDSNFYYPLWIKKLDATDNLIAINVGDQNVFDTWTPVYESDGVDQDGVAGVDQGTNGVDDGGTAAVDDTAERETMPPYSHPIRGLKVSFRLVEKNTKQLRQASIIHSFVPE
ncbi:MAG: hypothetical protein MK106_11550 [Mariniblastus sp.]|nr:hypothetical protein [Mariniblastus sp.]